LIRFVSKHVRIFRHAIQKNWNSSTLDELRGTDEVRYWMKAIAVPIAKLVIDNPQTVKTALKTRHFIALSMWFADFSGMS